MLTILKYTIKVIMRRKLHTLICVALLASCITGICTVTLLSNSIEESLNQYSLSKYGRYTMLLCHKTDLDYSSIESVVEQVGVTARIGLVTIDDMVYDTQFTVGQMNDNAWQLFNIKTISGVKPITVNEVAIEEQIANYNNIEIGDTLSLNFGNIKHNCEVVAIINDYSLYQQFTCDGKEMISGIIVGGDYLANAIFTNDPYRVAVIKTDGSTRGNAIIKEYAYNNAVTYVWNPLVTKNTFISEVSSEIRFMLHLCFITVIIVTIISAIVYNIYSWRIVKSQINDLKLSGLKSGAIMLFSLFNISIIFSLSIPVALITSAIACWGSIQIIRNIMDFVILNVDVSHICLIIFVSYLCCVIIRGLCTIESISRRPTVRNNFQILYRNDIVNIPFRIKNLYLSWVVKSLCLYKHYIFQVFLLMVLSSIVYMIGYSTIFNMNEEIDYDYYYDYDISCVDGNYITEFQIPYYTNVGIAGGIVNQLSENDEIQSYTYIRRFPILISEKEEGVLSQTGYISVQDIAYSIDSYQYESSLLNISKDEKIYKNAIYGIDTNTLSEILTKTKFDKSIESLSDGTNVVIFTNDIQLCPYNEGDIIEIRQYIRGDDKKELYKFSLNFSIKIIGVYQLTEDVETYNEIVANPFVFVWDINAFTRIGLENVANYLHIKLEDSDVFTNTESHIKKMAYNNTLNMSSKRSIILEQKTLLSIAKIITCLLTSTILICSMFIMSSIIRSRYQEQVKTWSILRIYGLTKRTVYLQHIFESVVVSLLTSISGYAILQLLYNNAIVSLNFSFGVYLCFEIIILISMVLLAVPCIERIFGSPICKNLHNL